MAHVLEPAPTGRAKCRGCGAVIAAKTLRFGEVLPNPFADGEMTHWFHPLCAAYKRPEPLLETLEGRPEPIEDQERLVAAAREGVAHPRLARVNGAERASSGRAECRSCHIPIAKDAWRIPLVFYEEGRFSAAGFIHVSCAAKYFETATDVMPRIRQFAPGLTEGDVKEIESGLAAPVP
jgi:Poly(ADP-ribose) polymerase and DNA-Ligase Zn-finger region